MKSESEVAQSYPTLSDPMDCSLPGSSVHGIFQARVLEWGAIAFSEINSLHINIFPYCVGYFFISLIISFAVQKENLIRFFKFDYEKAMAPHSSTPAWKIPSTEEPGRLQSMGSLRVGHD